MERVSTSDMAPERKTPSPTPRKSPISFESSAPGSRERREMDRDGVGMAGDDAEISPTPRKISSRDRRASSEGGDPNPKPKPTPTPTPTPKPKPKPKPKPTPTHYPTQYDGAAAPVNAEMNDFMASGALFGGAPPPAYSPAPPPRPLAAPVLASVLLEPVAASII